MRSTDMPGFLLHMNQKGLTTDRPSNAVWLLRSSLYKVSTPPRMQAAMSKASQKESEWRLCNERVSAHRSGAGSKITAAEADMSAKASQASSCVKPKGSSFLEAAMNSQPTCQGSAN